MKRWGCVVVLSALASMLAGCPRGGGAGGGCSKDRDCKGTRVCERGACVEPGAGSGIAATPSPSRSPSPSSSPGPGPEVVKPAPGGVAGTGWMLGGGPRHLGQAPGAAPIAEPKLVWEVEVKGPIAATPLVGPDGTVYFGSHDKSVYAVHDGKQLWSFATGDRVWSTPALAADGKVLYVGSDDDNLYALDAATGAKKWALRMGACVPQPSGKGPGQVLCDVDGAVTLAADGTIYTGGDAVHAVTPEGKLRWRAVTGGHVSSPPALSNDGASLYVGGQDGVIYALDAATGTQRWSVRVGDQLEPAPVVADDGTVYIGADDHKLYALAPTGEVKWSIITGLDIRRAAALGPDGTVYVGSHDKKLYAIRPDGTAAWTFTTAGKIHSSPAVAADGVILVASEDDRVYAVSAAGVLLWFIDAGEDVDVQPWLAADGTLILATDAGKLQAWR